MVDAAVVFIPSAFLINLNFISHLATQIAFI